MQFVCLDLEGVLVPEIWQHVAKRTAVPELNLTTRDIADYRELMGKRVSLCKANGIHLKKIQQCIAELSPLEGAAGFLRDLRREFQVLILSDTFYEFAMPLMAQLDYPVLLCHFIRYREETQSLEFTLRQENQKEKAVRALQSLNYKVFAAGDSYNDLSMLKAADGACFFRAPGSIHEATSDFDNTQSYGELLEAIRKFYK